MLADPTPMAADQGDKSSSVTMEPMPGMRRNPSLSSSANIGAGSAEIGAFNDCRLRHSFALT